MKNNNDEALKNYFDSMLHDNTIVPEPELKQPMTQVKDEMVDIIKGLPEELTFASSSTEMVPELEHKVDEKKSNLNEKRDEWQNLVLEDEFQVLFFELNNVTFAVPLADLGGIFELDDNINFLMGKPSWFSGVMKSHERLYNIVDTAAWLQLSYDAKEVQYTHYVVLGNSSWGLSCEKLLGTENLKKEQVRWRDKKGSRPWLAGMVKKRMCVLIHAKELVKLLEQGMDIQS